jgi:hypothetical protein
MRSTQADDGTIGTHHHQLAARRQLDLLSFIKPRPDFEIDPAHLNNHQRLGRRRNSDPKCDECEESGADHELDASK